MSMAIKAASYTGDPGLFGDIFRGITGAVGGLVTGGPLAALTGGIRGFKGPPTAGPGSVPLMGRADLARSRGVGRVSNIDYQRYKTGIPAPQIPIPTLRGAAERFFPLGATGMMDAPNGMPPMNGTAGGYHPNKTSYFLKSGEYVPEGTRWVKNRKRNPANARATSRAISRISGAKTYAKSLGRISIRKKC